MAEYSSEYNEQLAEELDAPPQSSTAIETAMTDYVNLRDRVRSCEKEKGKL